MNAQTLIHIAQNIQMYPVRKEPCLSSLGVCFMKELKAAKEILTGDYIEIQNTSLRNNRDVLLESRPQLNKRQELILKRSIPVLNKYK